MVPSALSGTITTLLRILAALKFTVASPPRPTPVAKVGLTRTNPSTVGSVSVSEPTTPLAPAGTPAWPVTWMRWRVDATSGPHAVPTHGPDDPPAAAVTRRVGSSGR